jgi:hypothetical protein
MLLREKKWIEILRFESVSAGICVQDAYFEKNVIIRVIKRVFLYNPIVKRAQISVRRAYNPKYASQNVKRVIKRVLLLGPNVLCNMGC